MMKECCEIVGNPDRQNITYEKHYRVGSDWLVVGQKNS